MAPMLQQGDPVTANGKVRRLNLPFDPSGYKKIMRRFEGVRQETAQSGKGARSVDFMYMDTNLNVTVGFGHQIRNLDDALSLNFVAVPPGAEIDAQARPASEKEITLAFNKLIYQGAEAAAVNKGPQSRPAVAQNKSAPFFETSSIVTGDEGTPVQVRLSRSRGETLFSEDVDRILNDTIRAFPEFNTFPIPAQFGFLDMTLNLGIGGVRDTFIKFKGEGIDRRNWAYAASESDRHLDEKRDNLVREKFTQAAIEEPFFHDPFCANNRRLDEWSVPGFM